MSHHSAHQHDPTKSGMKPHIKWTMIIGVILMIGAMLIYVFTMDEALVPGEKVQQPMPAAP